MANLTDHSRRLRAQTAAEFNREKLESGEYRQFLIKGHAADLDLIDEAVKLAGGSRTQALKAICEFYLSHVQK
ncbi:MULTISPECIES: hypothetical protein [Neisseriaceae]|uniref:Phage associated protein n=2 Tax=Neisseriaceae TaxID=481 RepID=A0A378UJI6_BERDE|nr:MULTISPECIES: hypothetical protein [Neisseriaceae]QEY23525.1 hypothetical protein D0T90_02590 [Neisseria animalis]ROW32125.1 hypothetical protein CGZ60_05970 [Neisseria animalis]STZ77497.1 phage associated protein [Bergeriella denitrificans]STZ83091.1 phage associated protein [Bergeriella denitrificans]VEE09142.1 phage associated protein [Neisseria animalis]